MGLQSDDGSRPKAIIWFIAARPCLRQSLENLYDNFNNDYRYPVVVFSFGKQYSGRFKKEVHRDIDAEITFVELEQPQIPSHIPESELFYHRKEIPYVREFFAPSRIGYLHTNQFVAGSIMKRPEMAGYDYALKLDDDTFIVDKIDYDLFRFVRDNGYKFAPFATQDSGHPRARQTQIGLRELAKEYIAENKIQPKSTALDDQGNWTSKAPRDPTIWDLNIFRSDRWENWWRTIDASGGIYAYRWGDLEIHSLYVQMYYPDSAWHGFDYYKKGIVVHGGHGVVHLDAQGRHRGKRTLARRIWNRLRRSVGLESIDA